MVALFEKAIGVLHHEALKMALLQAAALDQDALRAHAKLHATASALDAKMDEVREGLPNMATPP